MGNPLEQPNVILLPRLVDFFAYKQADIDNLANELYTQAVTGWKAQMILNAYQVGCSGANVNPPSGGDESYLRGVTRRDAESIAQTWNRDIQRQLIALFNARPRGNRYYYLEEMEKWTAARDGWKSIQIGIQTDQKAASYAQRRFLEENNLTNVKMKYAGPPPVSDICKERTAAGIVDQAYALANPAPGHPGPCIHRYQIVAGGALGADCATLWLG